MKKTSFFSIVSSIIFSASLAFSAGKIQNEDVKSVSDLTGAGSNATHLINDDKIWVKALGINLTFDDAILNQSLLNGITTTTRNAIAAPVTNQIIYNTTTLQFETWNGASWVVVSLSSVFPPPLESLASYSSNSEGGDPGTFLGNNSDNDQTNKLIYFGSTDTSANANSTSSVYIAAGDLLGVVPTGHPGDASLVAGGVVNTGGIGGGNVSVNGGSANDGTGGRASVSGGNSNSGNAGDATVGGGTSSTNGGGNATLKGGDANGGNQNGGSATVQGGAANGSGFGGQATLQGGAATVADSGGARILTQNVSNSGQQSGSIQAQTGATIDARSGNLNYYTGASVSGPTGDIVNSTGLTGGTRGTFHVAPELRLDGATSGYVGLLAPATVTSYSLTWPAAQGGAGTHPTNNGSGTLSWVADGATVALDNLVSTAVNADINPGVAGTVNLGTPSLYYNNVEGSTLQARSQVLLSDFSTPAQIRLSVVGTIPSGQSVPRIHTDAFDLGVDGDSLALFTDSEPTADANSTGNLYLGTGNKLAGTGNSGNVIIQPGTSFGGSPGQILLGQTTTPTTNGTFNLGSPTFGFNTIYTELLSSHTNPKGIVDLGNSQLYQSPANELILDWGVGRLFGNVSGSPKKSIDWNTRQIFKNDGSTVLLDWSGNEIHINPELRLDGSTSGYVGQKSPSAPTSYTVTWPTAQGGPNTSLVNDGAGNLFWASPGSGPATVSFISSQVTTDSTPVTGSSFVTFDNSPALTFTPTIGGTYAVYSPISVDQQTSAITGTTRIFNTSGGATVIGESDGVIYFQSAPGEATAYSETDYTLTAGVAYQFDIQGKNTGTGSLLAVGIEGPFYMFARLISSNNTVPVTMQVGLTTAYTPGANAPIIYDTVLDDSNSGYSTGTGLYTVPHTASYLITLSAYTTTSASNLRVAVNGVPLQYLTSIPTGAQVYGGSTTVKCNAGDTIAIWSSTNVEFFGQAPQYVNYLSIDEVH